MQKIINFNDKKKEKEKHEILIENQLKKIRSTRKKFQFNYEEILEILYTCCRQINFLIDGIEETQKEMQKPDANQDDSVNDIILYLDDVLENLKLINRFKEIYSSIDSLDYVTCSLSIKSICSLVGAFEIMAEPEDHVSHLGEDKVKDTQVYLYCIFKKLYNEYADETTLIRNQFNKKFLKILKELEPDFLEDIEKDYSQKVETCIDYYIQHYKKLTFIYEGTRYMGDMPWENVYRILNANHSISKLRKNDNYFVYVYKEDIKDYPDMYSPYVGWRLSHEILSSSDSADNNAVPDYYIDEHYEEEENYINEVAADKLGLTKNDYIILNNDDLDRMSGDIEYQYDNVLDAIEEAGCNICELSSIEFNNKDIDKLIDRSIKYVQTRIDFLI